jgi:hypothetical protein
MDQGPFDSPYNQAPRGAAAQPDLVGSGIGISTPALNIIQTPHSQAHQSGINLI